MRLLVCGGRMYGQVATDTPPDRLEAEMARAEQERFVLYGTLAKLHEEYGLEVVIEGNAYGADRIAGHWARKRHIENLKFPADWAKHGRAAGPIRNHKMLVEGNPDLVVAFPGGRGTADMVRRARSAEIRVIEVPK